MLSATAHSVVCNELPEILMLLEVLMQSFEREGYEAEYYVVGLIKSRLEQASKDLSSNR